MISELPQGYFQGYCRHRFYPLETGIEMQNHQSAAVPITGLPGKYFTDHEIFRRARENIFFRTWQYACHVSQVPVAGDYLSFSLFDQDIFVMRDRDGRLGAFYNVCRHRGHKLVEGSGNRKTIVCPYHAWSYELDGRLRGAPNAHKVAGFDARKIRLATVALEEFLGFIFVNLDAEAPPMDKCYPGVREAILTLCPDFGTRLFAHEYSVDEGCNWLIAVENYNECYHCKVAHPDFARGVIDPHTYNIAPFGEGYTLRHTSQASASGQAWYDVSGSDYGAFYLWPSTSIQLWPGGVLNGYCWRPLSVEDTEVRRLWYSSDGKVSEQMQKIIDLDRETVFAEDLSLVRSVQRGVNSRGFAPGPLIIDPDGGIDNELSTATLHRWMREAVDRQSA